MPATRSCSAMSHSSCCPIASPTILIGSSDSNARRRRSPPSNHPNVAQIFGFLEDQGRHAFVMELVEGRTLDMLLAESKRSGRGVGLQQACAIAARIADAMEVAHAHGILHRDLKPANVMVTTGSVVKVLDFGLATARSSVEPEPTLATLTAFTGAGVAIGTPAYMSPEQARGEAVDRRTDVWAFGCVFFEMLAGVPAFDGRTSSDIMAAVLTKEPDWSELPADLPPTLKRLLTRCLQKDTARRLRDLGDARLEIEEALAEPAGVVAPTVHSRSRRPWLTALTLVVTAIAAGAIGWTLRQPRTGTVLVRRLAITLPSADATFREDAVPFAVSPDGSKVVMALGRYEGSQLYVRALGEATARPLAGTLNGRQPFFSPDGAWIGFAGAGQTLRKVPSAGGPVETLAQGFGGLGAVWTTSGIFYSADLNGESGIAQVAATGGTPTLVSKVVSGREAGHAWPELLPDGSLSFTVTDSAGASQVVTQSLATGERRVLLQGATRARVASPGYLAYAEGRRLMAAPFDGIRVATDRAATLVDPVWFGVAESGPYLDVSDEGTLIHVDGARLDQRSLTWVDRQGRRTPIAGRPGAYSLLTLSPDGQRLAVTIRDRNQIDVWLHAISTGSLSRLTFNGAVSNAVWTPDGASLAFASRNGNQPFMMRQAADLSSTVETLFGGGSFTGLWPGSFSRDGQRLVYMAIMTGPTGGDLRVFDRATGTDAPVVETPFTEWGARRSPDNRVLAFVSNESGRWEVHVQPFPGPGNRRQISTDGGTEVVWSRDGRELFYRNGSRLMAVSVDTASLSVGQTTTLFDAPLMLGSPGLPAYDVTADGRFVMVEPGPDERMTQPIHVTLNWPGLIK